MKYLPAESRLYLVSSALTKSIFNNNHARSGNSVGENIIKRK